MLRSGVLQSGVLTVGGSYNQESFIQGFLQSGVLTIGFLQPGVLTTRGSYNQGFLQSGVLTIRGSYDQGFLQSGVQINMSYLTSLCPDVDNDRKSNDQGSVLMVNSHIQRVYSAQMLKLTLQDHIHIKPVSRCLYRS